MFEDLGGAYWHTGEWVGAILPYTVLTTSDRPHEFLLGYLQSLQEHGAKLMAWSVPGDSRMRDCLRDKLFFTFAQAAIECRLVVTNWSDSYRFVWSAYTSIKNRGSLRFYHRPISHTYRLFGSSQTGLRERLRYPPRKKGRFSIWDTLNHACFMVIIFYH